MPEPRGKPMSEPEVVAFLNRKILNAINDEDGDVSEERMDAFDYYVGKEYGNERDGASSYVSRETLEVVEWAKPSVMRSLIQDKVVQFDAVGPEDEEQADQETDVVNHILMKENKGFLELYQWVSDILLYPNGYIKAWVEEVDEKVTDTSRGLTMEQVAMIQADDRLEIVEYTSYPVNVLLAGQLTQVEVADVTVEEMRHKIKYRVEACPPDSVLVDEDVNSPDLDKADFVAHRYQKSYTDLVEMGLDADELNDIGTSSDNDTGAEKTNRNYHEDEDPDGADEDDDSMREFTVYECYARYDYDGTGLAQKRKCFLIGDKVFDNEEMDYQPFVSASSVVMSHKHVGMSLGEIVSDLQVLRSIIRRHILDNADRMNFPKKTVGEAALLEDGTTVDDLLDHEAEIIRAKDPSAIVPDQFQSMIGDLLSVDQSLKEELQNRTGIAPHLSLDPAVLQQATAGAFMGALEQANQRIELMVRLIAEVGLRSLMQKIHQQLRMYQDVEKVVKIRNQWVNVNPREWRERENMTVTVGLGFHSKPQRLMLLDSVLAKQKEGIPTGMVEPSHIYNTLEDMVEIGDLGDAGRYFKKPQQGQQFPQPENPQAGVVEATMQIEGQKTQQRAMEAQQKHQREMAEIQLKHQQALAEHQSKMQEMDLRYRELAVKIENIQADTGKTREETRQLDIENDAAESGVDNLLEELDHATG